METVVLSAEDCPKDGGWPKSGAPGMFAWQGDVYSYHFHLCKTSSDLSEQMHAIGGFYLPSDMLPYGFPISTEKHFWFATSVIESGRSGYNTIKYPTAPTWHHSAASSQMNHQSRDVHSLGGVFPKRDELPVCRTTPMARASSLTHSLQRPKSSKHSRASAGVKGRSSPATQKFSSCKDLCSSINDAPFDRIKGGQEGEYSSMNTSKAKAIMRYSSPSSKRDIYEDHCDGLVPFDPVVTSALITPLAINGCSQEVSQSRHSLAMNERWAGPAFSNSPPPSSLPVPTFTRGQSSLEIPRARAKFLADSICVSALGTPSRSFSLPNVGVFPSHLDTNHATQSLRRLLNLDLCT